MLFEIINFKPENHCDDMLRVIQNLLRSHHDGQNILIGPLSLFEFVIENVNAFSRIERNAANQIKDTLREYRNIKRDFSCYTLVDFEHNGIDIRDDNEIKVIKIGWRQLLLDANCISPCFVVENETDYKFYMFVAEYFVKKKRLPIYVKLEFGNGGGSQIHNVFEYSKANKNFVLCIVDSDKKHPNSSEGSTSSNFHHKDRLFQKNSCVFIIDVREIESLIPLDVLRGIVDKYLKDRVDALDFIEKVSRTDLMFRNHFDHKDGCFNSDLMLLDLKNGSFFVPTLKDSGLFNCRDCISIYEGKVDYHDHKCVKFTGFGDKLLRFANDFISNNNIVKLFDSASPCLIDRYMDIGALISSFGCTLKLGKYRG